MHRLGARKGFLSSLPSCCVLKAEARAVHPQHFVRLDIKLGRGIKLQMSAGKGSKALRFWTVLGKEPSVYNNAEVGVSRPEGRRRRASGRFWKGLDRS